MAFWWALMMHVITFWADISTGDAHLDPVLLHLHLVAGTGSDTGAVVHHKVICHTTHRGRTNGQMPVCPWTNSKQSLWKRPLTFWNGREETSILRQKPLTHPHRRSGDHDCGVCVCVMERAHFRRWLCSVASITREKRGDQGGTDKERWTSLFTSYM